jgi:hypothetical protein
LGSGCAGEFQHIRGSRYLGIAGNQRNTGAPEVRYYKAETVLGNFATLVDIGPLSNYGYEDTAIDADTDYKYKGAFVASGTINGVATEVVGQRSTARYVIATSSTL